MEVGVDVEVGLEVTVDVPGGAGDGSSVARRITVASAEGLFADVLFPPQPTNTTISAGVISMSLDNFMSECLTPCLQSLVVPMGLLGVRS